MDGRTNRFLPLKPDLLLMIGLIFIMAMPGIISGADRVDNGIWADLLERHVHKGRVDYDGFQQDKAVLDSYLDLLDRIDPDQLSQNQKLAFYINLYNASTINLILTRYPRINSIKEIGSFFSNPWSKRVVRLKGRKVSLDHVEHDILRELFKDPRIHFAINCASKGCPPLLNRPYEAENLEQTLETRTSLFINNPKQVFIKNNTLFASRIFRWFSPDFNDNPPGYIRRYAKGELKKQLAFAGPNIKIEFLNYDWSLNR